MSTYSIKDLEKISGIKTHTIRIWEQRYNLFNPERTETNIRYYKDEDVRKLLQIESLQNLGFKISKIVQMTEEDIRNHLSISKNNTFNPEQIEHVFINKLLESGMVFDEKTFTEILNEVIEMIGLKNAFQSVLYNVLIRVGLLWEVGDFSPAQEHFISCLIRDRIILETSKLPIGTKDNFVLWLPETEEHEIGLLYLNFMLRYFGFKVIYLGARVPKPSLEQTLKNVNATSSYAFIVSRNNIEQFEEYKQLLDSKFPEIKCYWSGLALKQNENISSGNHLIINSIEDFFNHLL